MGLAVAPASAETESDQLWIDAPSEQALPLGTDGGAPQSRTIDVGIYHDNGHFTVTDGKVSVDASGLAGVGEVTWPDNCAPNGATAVCSVPDVPVIGSDYSRQIHLGIRAADGARAGRRAGSPTGRRPPVAPTARSPRPRTVSRPTSRWPRAPISPSPPWPTSSTRSRVAPRRSPSRLTNKGNESAHGVTVKMTASYGVDFLKEDDAGTYTRTGGDEYAPMTDATCTFDQVLAPGDSFELPVLLQLAIARHALNDRLDISVDPADGADDLASRDNYAALQIGTDNTADFWVTRAAVTGTAGQTVTAPLTFKNNGPAWFANLGSGDPAAKVRLLVPTGTTVTGVPADCVPHTLTGGYYEKRTGAPRYTAPSPTGCPRTPSARTSSSCGSTRRCPARPVRSASTPSSATSPSTRTPRTTRRFSPSTDDDSARGAGVARVARPRLRPRRRPCPRFRRRPLRRLLRLLRLLRGPRDRLRDLLRVEGEFAEHAADGVGEAGEVEAGCLLRGVGAVHDRAATPVEDVEVADDALQGAYVPRRGDHDVRVDPPPVGEDDLVLLEALHRGHDLDAPLADGVDGGDVLDGDGAFVDAGVEAGVGRAAPAPTGPAR